MHTAGLKGEPLAAIPPEIREEWLETLDRAVEAMCTLGTGLAQAMNTLKALQSETSDFPVNLPDLGQSVLNLATEHDA
jgi:archaellum component FlaC